MAANTARIHVAQAQPLGEFDTWRQALPITLLEVIKPPMKRILLLGGVTEALAIARTAGA